MQNSRQVIVNDISMVDSQQIHINFLRVVGGHANNVTINAPWSSPNTDGIHIQETTNFVIQNCHVSTGLHLYPASSPPTIYVTSYINPYRSEMPILGLWMSLRRRNFRSLDFMIFSARYV